MLSDFPELGILKNVNAKITSLPGAFYCWNSISCPRNSPDGAQSGRLIWPPLSDDFLKGIRHLSSERAHSIWHHEKAKRIYLDELEAR